MSDGRYAFPRQLPNVFVPPERALAMRHEYAGMSLYEWYVGKALCGLEVGMSVDSARFGLMVAVAKSTGQAIADIEADECLAIADAIIAKLAERAKGDEEKSDGT